MSLGPIDREMANPPEIVGEVGHRRGTFRASVARTQAIPGVDARHPEQPSEQPSEQQHTWNPPDDGNDNDPDLIEGTALDIQA